MFSIKSLTSAAIIVSALGAAPALAAITTFASFSPIGTGSNFRWVNDGANNTGTGGSAISISTVGSVTQGSRLVAFSFLQPSIADAVNNVNAIFSLNSSVPSGNPASQLGGFLIQEGIGGSFSFTSTTDITVGTNFYAAGSNLLTGTFVSAALAGQRNGTSANFGGSTAAGDVVVYTSDFLTFENSIQQDFSMSLTSVTGPVQALPFASVPTAALRSFRAVASGTFSADPAPIVNGVPEPEMWGLMVVGFGMVGVQVRRRARRATLVA